MEFYYFDLYSHDGAMTPDHRGAFAGSLDEAKTIATDRGKIMNRCRRAGDPRCVMVAVMNDRRGAVAGVRIQG